MPRSPLFPKVAESLSSDPNENRIRAHVSALEVHFRLVFLLNHRLEKSLCCSQKTLKQVWKICWLEAYVFSKELFWAPLCKVFTIKPITIKSMLEAHSFFFEALRKPGPILAECRLIYASEDKWFSVRNHQIQSEILELWTHMTWSRNWCSHQPLQGKIAEFGRNISHSSE